MKKQGKMFSELVDKDIIYYIDPKEPTKYKSLTIKGVEPSELKKGHVTVEYYKSSHALSLVTADNIEAIPTGKIICPGNATSLLTFSFPMSIYFTSEKAIKEFMGSQI